MKNVWDIPGATARLIELHPTGSSGYIAKAMTAEFGVTFTRNAIIGKSVRLDLPKRTEAQEKTKAVAQRTSQAMRRARKVNDGTPSIAPDQRPLREAENVTPRYITLAELNQSTECHYIPNDDGLFCGCAALPDKPYCEPHQRLTRTNIFRAGNPLLAYGHRKNNFPSFQTLAAIGEDAALVMESGDVDHR